MIIALVLLLGIPLAVALTVLADEYLIRSESNRKLDYSAEIVLDSITHAGVRLTTFLLVLPKWLLAELNTHRAFSRNASSSRSQSIVAQIRQVIFNPVLPVYWGANQRGMVAEHELSGARRWIARQLWLLARYPAVVLALLMYYVGLHKQLANRILEPWVWAQDVVTTTDFENFFELRCHPDAQPEMRVVAERMQQLYRFWSPRTLNDGEWHLPFITTKERHSVPTLEEKIAISIARCARASAFQAGGYRSVILDLSLFKRLRGAKPMHISPFEHVCRAAADPTYRSGNVRGWIQYRTVVELGLEHSLHQAESLVA